jgi:hypothetical protein
MPAAALCAFQADGGHSGGWGPGGPPHPHSMLSCCARWPPFPAIPAMLAAVTLRPAHEQPMRGRSALASRWLAGFLCVLQMGPAAPCRATWLQLSREAEAAAGEHQATLLETCYSGPVGQGSKKCTAWYSCSASAALHKTGPRPQAQQELSPDQPGFPMACCLPVTCKQVPSVHECGRSAAAAALWGRRTPGC